MKEEIRSLLEQLLPLVDFDSDFLFAERLARYHGHPHDLVQTIWHRPGVGGCHAQEL